ncbi:MAG TPA: glycosyltransferase family 39 protein [Thermoanaerobaculia bacterium]|nr:glycosyltransferase family 39 protein [Thermoanaerobaculia bacterium]
MRRPLFWLLVVTFSLKAAVLAQFDSHPLLQPAGNMDSGVYARLAADVARGDLLLRGPGSVPFFVSPLYIYFLAAVHALSHGSLLAAKAVQIALGTAAVGLVWGMTRRLFDDRAALVAGILYALTGFVTFHEVLILQAALDPFLTALCLFLLTDALARGSFSLKVNGEGTRAVGSQGRVARSAAGGAGRWLAAGAAFGLLALNRPNALLCVVAIAVALALSLRSFVPVTVFLAGTGAIVALPLARNLIVSGEPVLISSHGGLNFLVGNGPGANGVYRALPGITPDIGGQSADTKRIAEAEEGRPLTTREVSAHFARKAWAWIAHEPGTALSLFVKKVRFVLSGDEAPLNFSFPWYRERSFALKLLAVGPGLLVPLAGAGFVLALFGSAGASRRALLAWSAFVPAYVLAVAVFFVATRYRLPLLVALAPLSGAAVARLPEAWRAKGARFWSAAATAALLAGVSLWPTGLWDGAQDEDMHLVLWEIERGDAGAMRHAEAAAREHPDPALVWLRVGRSFEAAGKSDEAIVALSRSHEIDPDRPGTATLLSALLEKRGLARALAGDTARARPDLEEAVRLDGTNAPACVNLAAVLAEKGDRSRARELTQRALVLRPGYDKAEALLRALR